MTSPTADRRFGLVGNTPIKAPVDCATTTNITLSGEQTIDGFTTNASRVLVLNQSDATKNGIYDTSSAAWTRSADCDNTYDLVQGTILLVRSGSTNGNTFFGVSTPNPVIGSALHFAAAVTGTAATLSFIQAGTGATTRGLQTKARETVSLRDFGAAMDGVTDDRTALSNANAQAVSTGASLLFEGVCHVASTFTITVPLVDTMAQIFSTTSQVKINNRLPIRPEWFQLSSGCLLRAATACVSGVPTTIQLENQVYPASGMSYGFGGNGVYLSFDHITIQGRRKPQLATDCKSLTGGSVIQGPLLNWSTDFELRDVGVDNGYTVNGGVEPGAGLADAIVCSYPNNAIKAGGTFKSSLRLHNVIGLCFGPATAAHAVLVEGFMGVTMTGEVTGCYGVHGIAIKSQQVRAQQLTTYCTSTDGVIIKTDTQTYSVASDVDIASIYSNASGPPGWSPYAVATTGTGILFNPSGGPVSMVGIGFAKVVDYPTCVGTQFDTATALQDVVIGRLITDQLSASGGTILGLDFESTANQNLTNFRVDSAHVRNTGTAVRGRCTQPGSGGVLNHVSFGVLSVLNAGDVGVDIGSATYMDIGTMVADNCSAGVYRFTGTPKLQVNQLWQQRGTTPTYSNTNSGIVPSLSNSWSQVAVNDPFSIDLLGGRINLRGLVKPGSAPLLSNLPQWAWPTTNKRFVTQGSTGTGTYTNVPLLVSSTGGVQVNEGTTGTANCGTWLSLSGITYDTQA